ncbi:hypothetical protein ACVIW2_006433 [Bradyrhizobium huanghuaihaiense]|jgi:hypothetical protein|uniref:Uncharacterized protein n=5 Tax=Bradyrhizobium TaxID=374 RepID=A0A1L3FRK0_BRAJP|nr:MULTISPECIES: hypothetical protein [Bradyrhizobium]AJA66169.1 hypothetical protein RN69_42490 [Bradyrhizobium japonicum]AND93020.1 hypothetical protein AAV28_38655 [Bradyrhizobium diazoefficiens USDA 110]APG15891.1 hypothetical protein BKD09_47160 [Bradyrhizobium japonicum]AWL98094.1 hypothetical protein CIT37_15575 [Bradyrhizobium ottawaense]AWO94868.1 hypothetical protein DI395_44595 [Bradyrhizobium diazoefficiens]
MWKLRSDEELRALKSDLADGKGMTLFTRLSLSNDIEKGVPNSPAKRTSRFSDKYDAFGICFSFAPLDGGRSMFASTGRFVISIAAGRADGGTCSERNGRISVNATAIFDRTAEICAR